MHAAVPLAKVSPRETLGWRAYYGMFDVHARGAGPRIRVSFPARDQLQLWSKGSLQAERPRIR